MSKEQIFDNQDVESTKSLAWLSYLGILFIIPMLVYKNSPYIKFHVNQGVILFILTLIKSVLSWILKFIPFIGSIANVAMNLAILALVIIGIVNAIQGNAKRLPIIGNIDLYR